MEIEETISHYDEIARHYATLIDDEPPGWIADSLRRLDELAMPDAPILEIGSGVGRDANWLEARGRQVRRTDAAPEFLEIQRERGHHADLLNVVDDDLGGPYGGVLAMAVLMHIPRESLGDVLGKLAAALLPGAPLVLCTREGSGDSPPPAAMAFYSREEFSGHLTRAGFRVVWDDVQPGMDDESWIVVVAVVRGTFAMPPRRPQVP